MKFNILSAKHFVEKKLKATIQSSGRLSFSDKTREEMELTDNSYVYFAKGSENGELYLIVADTKDENAFKVHKSGSYFYVSTKRLFDELKYDYQNNTIIFDLLREESLDEDSLGKTYKIITRILPKKGGRA